MCEAKGWDMNISPDFDHFGRAASGVFGQLRDRLRERRRQDCAGSCRQLSASAGGKRCLTCCVEWVSGLPVFNAAALDETMRGPVITGTLPTYSAIVDHEIYTHRYVMFTPGVLRKYDLPEVAALVAPLPLVSINPVDQAQRPLDAERAAVITKSGTKQFHGSATWRR